MTSFTGFGNGSDENEVTMFVSGGEIKQNFTAPKKNCGLELHKHSGNVWRKTFDKKINLRDYCRRYVKSSQLFPPPPPPLHDFRESGVKGGNRSRWQKKRKAAKQSEEHKEA